MPSTNQAGSFVEARRVLSGLTAGPERLALAWLARRVPAFVTSDHLTLLGLASLAACGALYAFSAGRPWPLLLVNVALALNWLGDSLDGTLARHRRCERPRFGFYVDHLADAFGALFVLLGLGCSGLMTPAVAAAVLIAYFLLAIETYLAAYTIGAFKISWGPFGGTELRIGLAVLNVVAATRPRVRLAGAEWLLFDVVGAAAAAGLLIVTVVAASSGTRALVRTEGWAPAGPPSRTTASARRPAP